VLPLAAALSAAPAADPLPPEPPEAERLVKQLGSARFTEREAAAQALDALGPAALPALRRAAQSENAEVRRRAGALIARHERHAESAAAFAPTRVRLKAAGAPLVEVIQDLVKQAPIVLHLAREPVDLAERPVTLDTGETSFWEALDALCRQARLSIRPTEFDPVRDADPRRLALPSVLALRGTQQELVLQDGVLPACPTAYAGAVRVRLVPDRWANRARGQGAEHQWALEVLSEPRVRWQSVPSFEFEPADGLTAAGIPQGGEDAATARRRALALPPRLLSSALLAGRDSPLPQRVMRHELPVYVTAQASAGPAAPELKGRLVGTVQLSGQRIATVADVTKADAAAAVAEDGTKLTVRDCRRHEDGSAALKVEVERPQPADRPGVVRTVLANAIAGGRAPPGGAAVMLNYLLEDSGAALRLSDEKGRPYEVTLAVDQAAQQANAITVTFALSGRPADAAAQPRQLELLGPRLVPVEAKFTLRDVPRP
jgi:hypothetical protein